mmetsp:Transcript_4956/g.7377  ORF Transcript_4956/g.7377 Transcript_4956/m.7377 type:complete len:382 (+) Transcript_4956:124-1269(+)
MGGSEIGDDDTLVLSNQPLLKEHEPQDTALRQQRIRAWNPILDPIWVAVSMLIIGVAFVPVGFKITGDVDDLTSLSIEYDAFNAKDPICGIGEVALANKSCTLEFEVDRDLEPPILVHYKVTGFNQNQRSYVDSRDDVQLLGRTVASDADDCNPLRKIGDTNINPCGLIANTFFYDKFPLQPVNDASGQPLQFLEEGIAWESDMRFKFAQPEAFKYDVCDSCDDCSCTRPDWSCDTPYVAPNGTCFRYFYPDDDTTRYLHETYPLVVNPIEGVTNEHFIVWMRVAALPSFQKLYGYFNQPIAKGTTLKFDVLANWEVTSFRGSKSLIVSTSYIFGGKNPWLGRLFIIVGFVSIALGVFFLGKQIIRPRKLADRDYLMYKED